MRLETRTILRGSWSWCAFCGSLRPTATRRYVRPFVERGGGVSSLPQDFTFPGPPPPAECHAILKSVCLYKSRTATTIRWHENFWQMVQKKGVLQHRFGVEGCNEVMSVGEGCEGCPNDMTHIPHMFVLLALPDSCPCPAPCTLYPVPCNTETLHVHL